MAQIKCFMCGTLCHDYGSTSRSACGTCAKEIFDTAYPGHGRTAIVGDGFPLEKVDCQYTKTIKILQDKKKNMKIPCHICGVYCRNWGTMNGHTSACPRCADRIMDAQQFAVPSMTRELNKHGNGFPASNQWDKAIASVKQSVFKQLPSGTRVEITGLVPGIPSNMNGTLVDYINGSSIIALDKELTSPIQSSYTWNQGGVLFDKGKKLGLDMTRRTYFCIAEASLNAKISKVISYPDTIESGMEKLMEPKTDKIDPITLAEGDRVQLRIIDPSALNGTGQAIVEATYLARDSHNTAMFALDQPYITSEHESWDWDWNTDFKKIKLKEIAEKYGIKSDRQTLWSIENNPQCETSIVKILKHQTPKRNVTKMKDANGSEMSIGQIFMQDSGKAAIRSGATLGIDGLKAGISKMLESQGVDGPGVKAAMKFFDTKLGDSMLRGGLGYMLLGLPIPYIQENEYAQQLSEELRISGLSGGMDQAAAMVKMFILPALLEAFKETPIMKGIEAADKKARVSEAVAPQRIAAAPTAVEQEVEELEMVADPFKAPKQASL